MEWEPAEERVGGPNTCLSELGKHVSLELLASRAYLYFSHLCARQNLDAYAHLFQEWSEEEHRHAQEIVLYLGELGARVGPETLEEARMASFSEEAGLEGALEASLSLERLVGANLFRIYRMALGEGDAATVEFLSPFVRLVPKEINEKETHLQRVRELGPRLANDTLPLVLDSPKGGDHDRNP